MFPPPPPPPPPPPRFSQLVYLALIGKRSNLPYLRRDAILIRFIHGFLTSAPHLILHFYVALETITPFSPSLLEPANLTALTVSTLSVLYSILSFTTSDRVSGKNRRVILPGHVTQVLWYLCMLASRLLVLALFAYFFSYYVFVLIGAHWVLMLILLLVQRTTFCADLERMPDGELKFTRRWSLEIPFNLVASTIYVFIYFNLKRGRTKIWAGMYHLLMLAENSAMAALVYIYANNGHGRDLPFNHVIALVLVIGLYAAGIVFMFIFYLLYHPNRTGCCFWVGLPKKCCPCCLSEGSAKVGGEGRGSRERDLRAQVGNGMVVISEPTLVSHNGFVPRNLLPVGPRAAEAASPNGNSDGGVAGVSTPQPPSTNFPNGHIYQDNHISELDARLSSSLSISGSRARNGLVDSGRQSGGQEDGTKAAHTSNLTSPVFVTPHSSRVHTLGGSNVAKTLYVSNNTSNGFSSELDTIIDSPLFENTAAASDRFRFPHKSQSSGSSMVRGRAGDIDSQRSCTDDTGIEMDSDHQLTQGTIGVNDETGRRGQQRGEATSYEDGYEYGGGGTHLPLFTDTPASRHKHHLSRQTQGSSTEDQVLPPPSQFQELDSSHNHTRPSSGRSLTPTLPTPTYSSSPTEFTPPSHRKQQSKRNFVPDNLSTGSLPSPEQWRKPAKSPIGARAFPARSGDEVDDNGSSSGQVRGSVHGPNPQIITTNSARSPKGAQPLFAQQHDPLSSTSHPPSKNVADRRKNSPCESQGSAIVPPSLQKESQGVRPTLNGVIRGTTSLTVQQAAYKRAQSSSPLFNAYALVKHEGKIQSNGIPAPGAEQIRNSPTNRYGLPGRSLSSGYQHPQRSRVESWHGNRAMDNSNASSVREKRKSAISSVEGSSRPNYYHVPRSSVSAFTHIPQDRRSGHLYMHPHSQSRHSLRECHSPSSRGQSVSSENTPASYRITHRGSNSSKGSVASLQQHNHNTPLFQQTHLTHYPRYPQGVKASPLHVSMSTPRKRLVSMPTRVYVKGTDIDKQVSRNSKPARSASADGKGLFYPSTSQRSNAGSPGLYDQLECEKKPEQQPQRQRGANMPPLPVRVRRGISQPVPYSHRRTLYAPTSSAHESAV